MTDTPNLAGQIRRDLWAIRDFYEESLEPPRLTTGVKLPTQAVPGEKMKYAPKTMRHSPPPVDLRVIEARMAAHRDLLHYTRVIQFEVTDIHGGMIQTRVDGDRIDRLASFIDTWADHLVDQTSEGDTCAGDMAAHAKALRHFARPDRRDWVSLGRCPFVVDGVFCRGRVRGYSDDRLPSCSGCGQEGVVEWWEEVMLGGSGSDTLTHESLLPFIHRAFGVAVKRATLRTWLARSVIEACGTDEFGRTLYSRDAVVWALSKRLAA